MTPVSSNIMWSTGRSSAALEALLPAPLVIRPIRSARRFRLRFDAGVGVLKLTCPARTSRKAARNGPSKGGQFTDEPPF